jgi:hypothetical protein
MPLARKESRPVREYDVFVPRNYNDGTAVERRKLRAVKNKLCDEFAGVTEIHLRKRGWWRLGGIRFRDKITIFRVVADDARGARRFLRQLKEGLKRELIQKEILIVERQVKLL